MFNSAFCDQNANIVSIEITKWVVRHAALFSSLGLKNTGIIMGEVAEGEIQNNNPAQPNFTLNLNKFKQFLDNTFKI